MRALVIAALLAVTAGLTACTGSDDRSLDVAAATSLRTPLTQTAAEFAGGKVRLAFGGSDVLAAQIRAGARPDVYLAASADLPALLARDGLVEPPVAFARNEIVLAVPRRDARVRRLSDLAKPGLSVALGASSVPVGEYADRVIDALASPLRERIRAAVRSREPDTAGVVGKLAQGAVDAGFVYRTDVAATSGRLVAISLPPRLQPRIVYSAAVVVGTDSPAVARAYIQDLVDGASADALRRAGFEAAP